MLFFRACLFYFFFTLLWLFCFVLLIPALLYRPYWPLALCRFIAHGQRFLLRVCCGVEIVFRGKLPKESDKPFFIASKHQSMIEAGILLIPLRGGLYALKRELLRIPIFGAFLWGAKMLALDRSSPLLAMKRLIKGIKEAQKEGRTLIIFPEGTRTRPGETIPYKSGVWMIYSQMAIPVIPVALNTGLTQPKGQFLIRPGTVIINFLDPIPPGLDRSTFESRLKEVIETSCRDIGG